MQNSSCRKRRKTSHPQKLALAQEATHDTTDYAHKLALYELRLHSHLLPQDTHAQPERAGKEDETVEETTKGIRSVLQHYQRIAQQQEQLQTVPRTRTRKRVQHAPKGPLLVAQDNFREVTGETHCYVIGTIEFLCTQKASTEGNDDDGPKEFHVLYQKPEPRGHKGAAGIPVINETVIQHCYLKWASRRNTDGGDAASLIDSVAKVQWGSGCSEEAQSAEEKDLTILLRLLRSKLVAIRCRRSDPNRIVGEIVLTEKAFVDDSNSSESHMIWDENANENAAQGTKGSTFHAKRTLTKILANCTSSLVNDNHPFMHGEISENKLYQIASPRYKDIPESDLRVSDENQQRLAEKIATSFRNYQLKAVAWMVGKETGSPMKGMSVQIFHGYDNIHPMWRPIPLKKMPSSECDQLGQNEDDKDTFDIFICPALGLFCRKPVTLPLHSCWRGGILADEMGLGKSLVVLGLMSVNRRNINSSFSNDLKDFEDMSKVLSGGIKCGMRIPSRTTCISGAFKEDESTGLAWGQCHFCHHWQSIMLLRPWDMETGQTVDICILCTVKQIPNPLASKASLIICPQSLLDQWKREIDKHCSSQFRVEIYPGIHSVLKDLRQCHDKLSQLLERLYRHIQSKYGSPLPSLETVARKVMKETGEAFAQVSCQSIKSAIDPDDTQTNQLISQCQNLLKRGKYLGSLLDPRKLGAADTILTSYSALSQDLKSSGLIEGEHESRASAGSSYGRSAGPLSRKWVGSLRYQKRYRNAASPLVRIGWWRVCLDESQMVDSPTTQAAHMARMLPAIYRWGVSGTPLTRSLADWHGLCMFLGDLATPWSDEKSFSYHVMKMCAEEKNMVATCQFLQHASSFMWRSSKRDVSEELALPPCSIETIPIYLSPIEFAFYQQQVQEQLSVVNPILREWRNSDPDYLKATPSRNELKKILEPLLRVRQACCHPQATNSLSSAGKRTRMLSNIRPSSSTSVLTMEQTLRQMANKTLREAEAALREMVAAYNGMAGALQLLEKPADALVKYHEAIQSSNAKAKELGIRIDPLQWLHTCYNCKQLLLQLREANASEETLTKICRSLWDILTGKDGEQFTGTTTLGSVEDLLDMKCNSLELKYLERISTNFRAVFERFGELSTLEFGDKNAFKTLLQKRLGELSDDRMPEHLVQGTLFSNSESDELVDEFLRQKFATPDLSSEVKLEELIPVVVTNALKNVGYDGNYIQVLQSLMRPSETEWGDVLQPTCDALMILVSGVSDRLSKARAKCWRALKRCFRPTAEDMQQNANCRICKNHFGRKGPTCTYCSKLECIKEYVSEVWTYQSSRIRDVWSRSTRETQSDENNQPEDDATATQEAVQQALTRRDQDKRAASPLFKLLSHIASDSSMLDVNQRRRVAYVTKGIQREVEICRELHERQTDLLNALDELSMAKTRLEVVPESYERKEEDHNFLYDFEVPAKLEEVRGDLAAAQSKLSSQTSRLSYLMRVGRDEGVHMEITDDGNVKMTEKSGERGSKDNACPVCLETLAVNKVLLPCAHRVCKNCIGMLMSGHPDTSLADIRQSRVSRCPECRRSFQKNDLCHVTAMTTAYSANISTERQTGGVSDSVNPTETELSSSRKVPRSVQQYTGSKLAKILGSLLEVDGKSPGSKCIVFSQWEILLRILELGCRDMEINAMRATSGNLSCTLASFQDDASLSVLLLPTSLGNHGLNITAANHVFFVEPPLNKGVEDQAIAHGTLERTVLSMLEHQGAHSETAHDESATLLAHSAHGRDEAELTRKTLLEIFDAASRNTGYTASSATCQNSAVDLSSSPSAADTSLLQGQ